VDAGREDGDPDVDDEAYGFDEQDEGGEHGDDDVVFGDPVGVDLVLVVLHKIVGTAIAHPIPVPPC